MFLTQNHSVWKAPQEVSPDSTLLLTAGSTPNSNQVAQGFHPVVSWKPPVLETAQGLWAIFSNVQLS